MQPTAWLIISTCLIWSCVEEWGRADKEAHAYLFYPDKSLLSDQALERLSALEECRDLGQGFQLAERDMGIRGFGNIFGEQQTGDVGNVGIDLFFEMLFESLSKVEEHRLISVPYQSVQFDININPHLPSEYINYLENPMEIISEAEKSAEEDIWSLMQFTENLRRQYGKEPYSMEVLLKKLYVKRMAADLGITRIYASGKTVIMRTKMNKKVFKLITDSMASDIIRNSLVLRRIRLRRNYFWSYQESSSSIGFSNAWLNCMLPCQPLLSTSPLYRKMPILSDLLYHRDDTHTEVKGTRWGTEKTADYATSKPYSYNL
ncbi:ATP-dependent DNA helicase, chloroplastic [Vitis vinifera]|uniref:ATP-dependent DNA helicase, chloroplastic n=1 Tax=Vitis vinifera TaxID=29760 RepID=A0A438EBM9_VITVI|nr:ATP-dependent DNA helicase, chloroplastic [Vitis vinifera]